MKTNFYQLVLAILLIFVSSETGLSIVVDFEGLGLISGDPVPSIGVASFTASAARQGSAYAFISNAGNGTGWLPPFNAVGNTFITNPGGLGAQWNMKTIEISFNAPVYDFSFFAADIDSANPTIERLTAKVFDAASNLLGEQSYHETSYWSGDGNVIKFDFGGINGIRRVTITLDNLGPNYDANDIGFGVDNLEFKIASPPVPIPITIDIKPGSDSNTINIESNGIIPVAILGTTDFDATSVDPGTVLLADAYPVKWTMEDINHDGIMDLLLHFKTEDLILNINSTEASLTGKTMDGTPIEGADTVNIVPKK